MKTLVKLTIVLTFLISAQGSAIFPETEPLKNATQTKQFPDSDVAPAPVLCSTFSPGLSRLRSGVDLAKLDLNPLDFTKDDGFRSPILDVYTCNAGKVWINPVNGNQYQVPDQIWIVESAPGGLLDISAATYNSYQDVKTKMAAMVGLESTGGAFSASGSYSSLTEQLSNYSRKIVDVSSFVSSSQAALFPSGTLKLGSIAQWDLDKLSNDFATDAEGYQGFISKYGTHYFSSAKFGGHLRDYFAMSSDYYLHHSQLDAETQASVAFFEWINLKLGSDESSGTSQSDFLENSSSKVLYYGGNTNLLETNGVSDWASSVPGNAWVYAGALTPIYELFQDESKEQPMKLAVEAHLDRAYLEELRKVLQGALVRYRLLRVEKLQQLLDEVVRQMKMSIPDHETVRKLGFDVDFNLIPPDWWSDTELCYRNFNDPKKLSKVYSEVCGRVNVFTGEYRELISMTVSWAIFASPYSDDWFEDVQFCYKYTADSFRYCYTVLHDANTKFENNTEICSRLGEYTPIHYNGHGFTGHFLGSKEYATCGLRWKLKLDSIEDAPVWFLNSQICFNSSVGLSKQARATFRTCAVVNEWTDVFEMQGEIYHKKYNTDANFYQWAILDQLTVPVSQ